MVRRVDSALQQALMGRATDDGEKESPVSIGIIPGGKSLCKRTYTPALLVCKGDCKSLVHSYSSVTGSGNGLAAAMHVTDPVAAAVMRKRAAIDYC